VRVAGHHMEAISGQILFDFEASELASIKTLPQRQRSINPLRESENWFQRGLDLEESGAPIEEVIEAYRRWWS
jgi:hypothetical protein